ncbi:MAG: hypothetical protein HQ582_04100 [Planctomycetes bacterium]|nr:hypothetical protein [Planctomycetota bacterium]
MPNHSTPSWFKPGLLPRRTRFGALEGVPPFREKMPTLSEDEIRDLLPKQDGLRQFIPPCHGEKDKQGILNQKSVGSCAAEALSQAISVLRVSKGLPWVELNPYGLYHFSGGGDDNGSTLDENIRLAMSIGVPPADVWSRAMGYATRPSEAALEAAHHYRPLEVWDAGSTLEMLTGLVSGYGVYYGSDYHAKLYVRAKSMQEGTYANSWDYTWGDNGYGTELFGNVWVQYGVFLVREVTGTSHTTN